MPLRVLEAHLELLSEGASGGLKAGTRSKVPGIPALAVSEDDEVPEVRVSAKRVVARVPRAVEHRILNQPDPFWAEWARRKQARERRRRVEVVTGGALGFSLTDIPGVKQVADAGEAVVGAVADVAEAGYDAATDAAGAAWGAIRSGWEETWGAMKAGYGWTKNQFNDFWDWIEDNWIEVFCWWTDKEWAEYVIRGVVAVSTCVETGCSTTIAADQATRAAIAGCKAACGMGEAYMEAKRMEAAAKKAEAAARENYERQLKFQRSVTFVTPAKPAIGQRVKRFSMVDIPSTTITVQGWKCRDGGPVCEIVKAIGPRASHVIGQRLIDSRCANAPKPDCGGGWFFGVAAALLLL